MSFSPLICTLFFSLSSANSQPTWDYALYVNSWAATECLFHNPCSVPSYVETWVIHGLWPNYNNGSWPQYCNSSYPFVFSEVQDLSSQLYVEWPDLYENGTDFWKHEWEKHGTCAMQSTVIDDEHDYFLLTLSLFEKQFLFGKWLTDAGIIPSWDQFYTLSEISEAITAGLGGEIKVSMSCKTYGSPSKWLLDQIYVCVSDPDYKPFNCPQNIYDSNYCPSNTPIYLYPLH
eukprot:TRINITY_DN1912_c0_g1_i2.p1 TRINITY_DN1912_c0_g1~~TRINITY_DN1912_c0_g1_i2.p1  ORF type:complete len:241 (-),score=26.18 TRINITY_DN1912_c0_g1_i2:145-837(-)